MTKIILPEEEKKEAVEIKRGSGGGILLTGGSKFLVQRIRDEAHRFAITNNRKARLKGAQKSSLDEVPGLGPKTKQKLLSTFGSPQNLLRALEENPELFLELIGPKMTQKLQNFFLKR